MHLENIMRREIRQKSEDPYDFTHLWDIKLKLTDTDNIVAVTGGKGDGNSEK